MKAISIQSPWAWAIMNAGKDYENRTWPTNYRGTVAVHVGKKVDWDGVQFLKDMGLQLPAVIHTGCIIGEVDIVDCINVEESGKPGSEWAFGPFCWKLANPRLYEKPIYCKGALGLFHVNIPEFSRVFVDSEVEQD